MNLSTFLFSFAKRFVAGITLDQALKIVKEYNDQGFFVTLDHLGEDIHTKKDAIKATNDYLNILKKIKQKNLQADIAIKLSQIGLAIDKSFAKQQLDKLIKEAKKQNLTLEIDMEGSHYTNDTLELYFYSLKKYKKVVVAIQAYLLRSKEDINHIIKNKGNIRLVKGAYHEPENIVFEKKEEVNKNYKQLLETCLNNKSFVSIATHDKNIIKQAKNIIKKHSVDKKHYTFAFLFGLLRKFAKELVTQGHPVRIYIPYGKQWFPYYYRRLRERKENILFVIRHLFS